MFSTLSTGTAEYLLRAPLNAKYFSHIDICKAYISPLIFFLFFPDRKKPRRNHQEPSHSSLTSESSNLPSKPEFFPADSLENTQTPSQSLITAEPDPQIQHQIFPTTNNDRLAYVTPPNNLVITS